jgi:hypothetical protein
MYCMLVFVSGAAIIASVPALWNISATGRIFVPLALLAMTWASYGAALASARGYIAALKEMNTIVQRKLANQAAAVEESQMPPS